jgi:phosphotriesterase-related protein
MKKLSNILLIAFCCFFLTPCSAQIGNSKSVMVYTVNGKINAGELGFALTHEHLFSNFGRDPADASRYDEQALYRQVIPYLKRMKALGVSSIFDCTTAYFGRRVDILKTIADSTGLHIITNTGFYGAANDRYVPDFVQKSTAAQIATLWIEEYKSGIEGSGIKPGFIKLAFDAGTPSETDIKLFTAGIIAHKETRLTMAVHTGDNPEAVTTQLRLLKQHEVNPAALIIVHAQSIKNYDILFSAAKQGALISLDGVNAANVREYIEKLKQFRIQKLLHKVLLSHDGDLFTEDGSMRELSAIMENLVPALKADGFTDKEIRQLMVINPGKAFGI